MECSAGTTGVIKRKSLVVGTILVLISCAVQLWIAGGGAWNHLISSTHCYSELAGCFLHGRLSLGSAPSPGLPAADAYVPDPNWLYIDLSLRDGKYYYYWGPVPAALTAAVCFLLGVSHPAFGDQYLCFFFAAGTVICSAFLIFQVRARLFPDRALNAAAIGILSLSLGAPLLFSLSVPAIYETAILAGQFFLLAGLCAAWVGLATANPRPGFLAVAGAAWAMSAGSRVSLPPALAALAVIALPRIFASRAGRGRKFAAALCLLLPLAAGAAAIGWYNHARFGSVFESGESYQINRQDQPDILNSGFVSPRHVLPNLLIYLFMPPMRLHGFPYMMAVSRQPWLGGAFAVTGRFISDPVVGLAWTQPFLALAVLAPLALRRARPGQSSPDHSPASWLAASLSAAAIFALASPLAMNFTAMRYLLDAVPSLSLLAAVGYMAILDRFKSRQRLSRELTAAAWTIVAAQCVIGLLLAVGRDPELTRRLAARWPIL
jgi:hypothetical protein